MKALSETYKLIPLIVPKSITATETGTGVNIEQYDDDALGIMMFGAVGGTTETHDVVFQGSLDDSTYVTLGTIGQVTGSNGDNKSAAVRVNLKGYKFVRALDTMSSTTAALVCAAILVKPMIEGASVNSATPA